MDKHEFNRRLGARIRHLREANEMSQELAASRAGLEVASSTWSRVELGKQSVMSHKLAAIADALDVSLSELFEDF